MQFLEKISQNEELTEFLEKHYENVYERRRQHLAKED